MNINTLTQNNLQENLKSKTFAPGELIVLEHDCYWLLQQGTVKVSSWTEEGNPITLGFWGENDLIGQPLAMVHPYQVRCLTAVTALRISLDRTYEIAHLIQHHVRQTEEILYILRSDNLNLRLRGILIWLSNKFGREIEIGQMIEIHLTHQDLAELVGATRVTVTKFINQFEREGFLSRPERNTLIVHAS